MPVPDPNQETVGTAAVQLLAATGRRESYTIVNLGFETVFLGDANVTASGTSGIALEPSMSVTVEDDVQAVFGISTKDGQIVEADQMLDTNA